MNRRPFMPDWVSAPGETIESILEERGMTLDEFSISIQKTPAEVQQLLGGQMEITEDLAQTLSSVLGASPKFWLNRERQYREDSARLDKQLHNLLHLD